jgi:hypothetical protein
VSTALDIIKDSLKKIGVIASGEALSSEEAADGLRALNNMIASWNTQNLIMLGLTIEEFTLTPAQNSYTLGSGGNFNTSVPIRTDAAFIKDTDGTEFPIEMIDNIRWGQITVKSSSASYPRYIYIDYNYPLQKVYLYPTPSEANTLILHNYRKLSSFATLTTSASLPDGYERAVIYNLALELAPDYGKEPSALILKIAEEGLANVKRVNIKPRTLRVDEAVGGKGAYDYRIGE